MISDPSKSEHSNEKKSYFYVLPWIQIQKPVRLNQLTLSPYPSRIIDGSIAGERPFSDAVFEDVMRRFHDDAGGPIENLTLVSPQKSLCVHEHDSETRHMTGALHDALQLLHLRYYDYDFMKSRHLQFEMMRFCYLHDEKKMLLAYHNWFNEQWEEIPKEIAMPDGLKQVEILFPVRRLREVMQSMQHPDLPLLNRIRMTLHILNIASRQSSQQDITLSLFLLCSVFTHLLIGHHEVSDDVLAFQLEDWWAFPFRNYEYHPSIFKNKQIKQVTHVQSFRVVKQPSPKKTWLQAWILELFRLKHEMCQGNPVHKKDYAWTPVQHLRIATEIIPMTIIVMLSKDPETLLPIKNEDEKRIRNVDLFLQYAKSLWYGGTFPHPDQPDWLLGKNQPNLWDSVSNR